MFTHEPASCCLGSTSATGKRVPRAATICLGLMFATAGNAIAEQPQTSAFERLPEVVVTATRIPTPVNEVASSMSVITAEDIERNQFRTVVEALQALPSLSVVRSGGPGKTTAIFSRGTNANQTLVLIDGIEINDPSTPDGRADVSSILLDNVERIEVLYGSQGTLYGSDAIGAVINVITKTGEGKPTVTAYAEGGSFTTLNQSASLRGGTALYNYSFNVQHLFSDGLSATTDEFAPPGAPNDDDEHENITLSARLGLNPTDNLELSFAGRYVETENELDLNVFPIQSDNDSDGESEQIFVRGDVKLSLFDGKTEHRLGAAYTRYDRLDRDDPDPINPLDFLRDHNIGTKLKFDLQNDFYLVDHHIFTLGLETEEESIDSSLVSQSAFGPFNSTADAEVRNKAVYFQDQVSYFDRLFGTVGVRVDDHETFGTEVTYRIAPAYLHLETATKIKGSYATGFRAPSLFQLFGSSISGFGVFVGNPNLKPEESDSWEVGFEQSLWDERLAFGATYFETEVTNLIEGGATTNANIGEADLSGVEAFVTVNVTENLIASANYAYTRPKNADTDADLLRRPRHKAKFNIGFRPVEKLTLSMEGVYVGKRFDVDAATFARIKTPEYFVLNLFAAYEINEMFQVFGRIENALDRDFEEPDGFTQPGVGGFVGLRARF